MVDAVSSSLAGLNNASQRLAVSSERIANASNPNYKPAPKPNVNNVGAAGVDIAEELVNTKFAEISYTASAKVLKVQLNTERELLDILA